MGIFSGCLLVSDIDGTLLIQGKIPEINIEAINYFKSEGGIFTVATGRGPTVGKQIVKKLGVNAPALFTNGSVIYDVYEDKMIYADYLSDECKDLVKRTVEEFPNIGTEVTLVDKIININDNYTTKWHREKEGFAFYPHTCEEVYDLNWIKALFMTEDQELLSKVKQFTQSIKPDSAEYIETSPIFYEVLVKGINKWVNIPRLAGMFNISKDKIFAIGDYYNDVEMVKEAAIGAFTKDAPEEIRPFADYISKSVYSGAVADFIDYLTTIYK